jgi:hypothetical protein
LRSDSQMIYQSFSDEELKNKKYFVNLSERIQQHWKENQMTNCIKPFSRSGFKDEVISKSLLRKENNSIISYWEFNLAKDIK